jgi:pyruvate/2-oxoglutarate dehydrogenase complex dihydrolipoamide acyltransferase (E2) component
MNVLIDHAIIDGAPMARFISDSSKNIENGTLREFECSKKSA